LIGSLTYDDDKRLIGLQAADALVYEVRKDLLDQMINPNSAERPELARLKTNHTMYFIGLCGKPCLEDFLRSLKMSDLR
jgi:hypothetical protein